MKIHHFPYKVIFLLYFIICILYFILFIVELHMRPHLPRFYHNTLLHCILSFKADAHIACLAHAVPLPCRVAKGLECVFPT